MGLVSSPFPSFMGVGTQQGTGVGSANAMMMNPLGLNYVYGPAIPMTRAQAGLFMLSTQQRMLGLGNGQISGVRPAGQDPTGRKTGRHEPNCGPHKERKYSGWPGRSLFQSGDHDGVAFPASFQAAVALFPSDGHNNENPRVLDLSERGIVPIVSRVKTDPAWTGRPLGEEGK